MDPVIKKLKDIVLKQQKIIKKLAQQTLDDAMQKAVQEGKNIAPGLKTVTDTSLDPQSSGYVDIGKVEPRQRVEHTQQTSWKPNPIKKSFEGTELAVADRIAKKNNMTPGTFNVFCMKYVKDVKKSDPSGTSFMVKISQQQLREADAKRKAGPLSPAERDKRIVKMLQLLFTEMFPGKAVKFTYSIV